MCRKDSPESEADKASRQEAPREEQLSKNRHQLHQDGWTQLAGDLWRSSDWELKRFVERLHKRYHSRIIRWLDQMKAEWMLADNTDSAPGASRPGGLVARKLNEKLKGSGVFCYAAHPSQWDEAKDFDYAGPRWYITCSEAAMNRFKDCGVAPPPPPAFQDILWPSDADRSKAWLTEIGWTIVPENSPSQVMHADICSSSWQGARQPGHGRYHHFAWKLAEKECCTTNVVSGGFSEGCATWNDYAKWTQVKANAVIFDSEMLHRGARTLPNTGWTTTLTIQVCSGTGWEALQDRVGKNLMWYTQPIGWQAGDAVDARVGGVWAPAFVRSRDGPGVYSIALVKGEVVAESLGDADVRYRQGPGRASQGAATKLGAGSAVQALFEGSWHKAKISRANADGTFRVVWRGDRSFTDGVCAESLKEDARGPASEVGSSCANSEPESFLEASPPATKKRVGSPLETPRAAKRRAAEELASPEAMRSEIFSRGWTEVRTGIPEAWEWRIFEFVEACYDRFYDVVNQELDSLRDFWEPCNGSSARPGAFAGHKVTERLKKFGVAVYSPGPSQSLAPPYAITGPRWYVSVTSLALEVFEGAAPLPPAVLMKVLHGHPADAGKDLRARGLGWTLAPAGSDPQALHADIWGTGKHSRTDRTRWPHILWKRRREENCTTEIVPGGYTEGACWGEHWGQIARSQAPCILVDSEALHRGAATAALPPGDLGSGASSRFKSTLSLELCTASGWAAWSEYATGGTTKDPASPLDWRMLPFAARPAARPAQPLVGDRQVKLPPAPWATPEGKAALLLEQQEWEFASC